MQSENLLKEDVIKTIDNIKDFKNSNDDCIKRVDRLLKISETYGEAIQMYSDCKTNSQDRERAFHYFNTKIVGKLHDKQALDTTIAKHLKNIILTILTAKFVNRMIIPSDIHIIQC